MIFGVTIMHVTVEKFLGTLRVWINYALSFHIHDRLHHEMKVEKENIVFCILGVLKNDHFSVI